MNREALNKMRLDRRLIGRRGWIARAELERAIGELPDRVDKATTLGEAADERDSGQSTAGDQAPSGA